MKFDFFKKKKKHSIDIPPLDNTFNINLPEIYRGVQVYESESDGFCRFDEDYFAGESYPPKSKTKKKITIPPPKTSSSFLLGIFCGALSITLLSGGIAFLTLFSRFGGIYRSVTVPDFTSLSEEDAVSLIKSRHDFFNYSIEYKENPYVSEGAVISQIPKPSTMRKLYGINGKISIKLTVSKSNEDITLPNLTSQSTRDVALELQNTGINVSISEIYSDTVKSGKIISASHSAGSKIQKNDTVYLTSSLGPQIRYVNTPSLVGMSESEAISMLKKHGLNINKVIYVSSSLPLGTVLEQSISQGESIRENSKISLTVSGGINEEE